MKDNNNFGTYLADWLAGNLTDEQLRQLVPEDDFAAYMQIRSSVASCKPEDPDMEANYAKIREKIAEGRHRKPTIIRKWYPLVAVAAAVGLMFGLYQLLVFSDSAKAGVGITTSVTLADNSVVTLNSNSGISYPSMFTYNRSLKLDGEAFFKVQKGSTFCVKTDYGDVQVLGTQFNVIARAGFFEVVCYEGRVKVSKRNEEFMLAKGDAVRFSGEKPEIWKEDRLQQPTWLMGESTFKNVPLYMVLNQLENQYGYKLQYPQHLKHTRFSGAFSNKDLTTALLSVCLPLNLKYHIGESQTIIISE
ncbi:MAG TPA: FecR domain-containing protein [Flavobacterium sp.]